MHVEVFNKGFSKLRDKCRNWLRRGKMIETYTLGEDWLQDQKERGLKRPLLNCEKMNNIAQKKMHNSINFLKLHNQGLGFQLFTKEKHYNRPICQ